MNNAASDDIKTRKIEYSGSCSTMKFPSEKGFKVLRLAYDMAEENEKKLKNGKMKSDDPEKKIVRIRIVCCIPYPPGSLEIGFKTPQDVANHVHTRVVMYSGYDNMVPWNVRGFVNFHWPYYHKKRADGDRKHGLWPTKEQIEQEAADKSRGDYSAFCEVYDLEAINNGIAKYASKAEK